MATAAICESARISRSDRFTFHHGSHSAFRAQDIYQVLHSLSNPFASSYTGASRCLPPVTALLPFHQTSAKMRSDKETPNVEIYAP